MTSPWFRFDVAVWPEVVALLKEGGAQWPRWAVIHDLRWMDDQLSYRGEVWLDGRKAHSIPGRRRLALRWGGWGDRATRTVLAAEGEWKIHGGWERRGSRGGPASAPRGSRGGPASAPRGSRGGPASGSQGAETTGPGVPPASRGGPGSAPGWSRYRPGGAPAASTRAEQQSQSQTQITDSETERDRGADTHPLPDLFDVPGLPAEVVVALTRAGLLSGDLPALAPAELEHLIAGAMPEAAPRAVAGFLTASIVALARVGIHLHGSPSPSVDADAPAAAHEDAGPPPPAAAPPAQQPEQLEDGGEPPPNPARPWRAPRGPSPGERARRKRGSLRSRLEEDEP